MSAEPSRLRVIDDSGSTELPGPGSDVPLGDVIPSPGQYIQEHRRRRGFSLEQLAAATKIPKRQLEALEDDRFADLPGQVFVKGFIRCCSRALSLNDEVVLGLLYDQERELLRAKRREANASGTGEANDSKLGGAQARRKESTRTAGKMEGKFVEAILELVENIPTRVVFWAVMLIVFVTLLALVVFSVASSSSGATPVS